MPGRRGGHVRRPEEAEQKRRGRGLGGRRPGAGRGGKGVDRVGAGLHSQRLQAGPRLSRAEEEMPDRDSRELGRRGLQAGVRQQVEVGKQEPPEAQGQGLREVSRGEAARDPACLCRRGWVQARAGGSELRLSIPERELGWGRWPLGLLATLVMVRPVQGRPAAPALGTCHPSTNGAQTRPETPGWLGLPPQGGLPSDPG